LQQPQQLALSTRAYRRYVFIAEFPRVSNLALEIPGRVRTNARLPRCRIVRKFTDGIAPPVGHAAGRISFASSR